MCWGVDPALVFDRALLPAAAAVGLRRGPPAALEEALAALSLFIQHRLYLRPLLHGHGSFGFVFMMMKIELDSFTFEQDGRFLLTEGPNPA